jgi:hypothetical protein
MRLYLNSAQLGVDEALKDKKVTRMRRNVSANDISGRVKEAVSFFPVNLLKDFDSRPRRHRRHTFGYNVTEINLFVNRTNTLLESMKESNPGALEEAIVILKDSKTRVNEYLAGFNLTAPSSNLTVFLEDAFKNGIIDINTYNNIIKFVEAQDYDVTQKLQVLFDLAPTDLNVSRDVFCGYYSHAALCLNASTADTPMFTCHGVIASGQAAVALSVDDLVKWDSVSLYDCLEVLGSVDWPQAAKRKVWSLLVSKQVGVIPCD